MASGSNRYIAYQKETVPGTLPSPFNATKLRVVSGSGIENARTNISSDEIRDDRQIIVARLGQNAPALTVPGELSFVTYEDLIEGALGNVWVANYDLNPIVVDVAAGATITTNDASTWASKGVVVGDYITITGLTVTAENGVYYVKTLVTDVMTLDDADALTPAVFTLEAAASVRIVGSRKGTRITATSNNITVVATAKTITVATAVWVTTLDIRVGSKVYFDGFVNAGNNGYHQVTAVTDTVLTLGNSTTLVDETLAAGVLDVANADSIITCGVTLPSFSFEEGFTDVSEYHHITGAKVGTWSMTIQTDSILTTEFQMSGVEYHGFESTTSTSTLAAANTNDVFDSYTGTLIIPGVGDCVITGFDFSLENNLNVRYALLQKDACSIGDGRITVTGTLNAYFPDSTLSAIYNSETELNASLYFEDLDGNGYTFGFPKLKFTSDALDVSENDVTEAIGFQALGGDTTFTTMYIIKHTKVA